MTCKNWQSIMESTTDFSVDYGLWRLTWEYVGEGRCGDYDEDDPRDAPHLRATLYFNGEEVEDGSYCTLALIDTNQDILTRMSSSLFANLGLDHSVYKKINRKLMQKWTWDTVPSSWKPKELER